MRPKTAQSFHPHERAQTTTTGYIYILTNPSFPQYGKLGYATGVRHLRGGFCPLGQEAPLHSGQAEPRSAFCRRSGRQAPHPGILCHAAGGRLRDPRGDRGDQRLPPPSEKTEGDDNSAEDEALARQIEEQHRERVSPFAFSKCGISEGAELEFCCRGNEHTGERCTVADDKHVRFQDEIWSLTALAKHLLGTRNSVAGPQYFKYNGAWLNAIRRRLENRE